MPLHQPPSGFWSTGVGPPCFLPLARSGGTGRWRLLDRAYAAQISSSVGTRRLVMTLPMRETFMRCL